MNPLLAALAAHRASRAVSKDSISDPIRRLIQIKSISDELTDKQRAQWHWLHELLKCPYCTGFWLSGITVVAWWVSRQRGMGWLRWPMMWWAVSGAQSVFTGVHHILDMQGDLLEHQVKMAKKGASAA